MAEPRVADTFPLNCYRGGDALTGQPSNNQPVLATGVEANGYTEGEICFSYNTMVQFAQMMGFGDVREKDDEISRLKDRLRESDRQFRDIRDRFAEMIAQLSDAIAL